MVNTVSEDLDMTLLDDFLQVDGLRQGNIDDTYVTFWADKLSKNQISDFRSKIQGNPDISDEEKRHILDNLNKIEKTKNVLLSEGADSVVNQARQLLDLDKQKSDQKFQDLQNVEDLKRLLDEKNGEVNDLKKIVSDLLREIVTLSDKNSETLRNLKDAKNSNDTATIAKLKAEIKEIIAEKEALRDKYAGKLPNYEGDIKTMDTKRLEFKTFGNSSVDGQKVLTGPQLRFRQNLRSRKRINTTVQKLNEIGNDPKKGVNFVLTRTFGYDPLNVSGKVGSGFKNMRKFFKVRDVQAFDEMYNKQKQYFLDNLVSKMELKSMSEKDKQVIDAIKKRLDYYQAAYKRQFITV